MAHSEEVTPVVTLSDWAHVGNKRNLIRVRPPQGNDSLVRRITEGRTTDADRRFLESVKRPPPLATIDEVNRLWDLLAARNGDYPDSPEKRLAMAKRAVKEIAEHQQMRPVQVWSMTIADAADILATVPITTEVRDTVHQLAEATDLGADAKKGSANLQTERQTGKNAKPVATSPSGRVVLYGMADKPVVDGKERDKLTSPQYDVVRALLKAGEDGLTKDELEGNKTGHGGGRGVLTRLSKKPGWKAVIALAGNTGKRYRIR